MSTQKILLEIIQEAKEKNLTRLDFSGNNLRDLPQVLFKLDKLEVLNLNDNQLTSLPAAISELNSLRRLSIRRNRLNDLPMELGHLNNLIWLYLDDNQLQVLPETMGQLKNLTRLSLRRNLLTHLPQAIGRLTKLMVLNLESNKLNALPNSIGNLTGLKSLHVSHNQLSLLPDEITHLSKLNRISFSYNQIDALPTQIDHLQELVWLYAQNNHITHLPEELARLKYLETIDIRNNQLITIPSEIAKIGNLYKFYFAGNPIDHVPPEIIQLHQLFGLSQSPREPSRAPTMSIKNPTPAATPPNTLSSPTNEPPPEISPSIMNGLQTKIMSLPKGKVLYTPPQSIKLGSTDTLKVRITRDLCFDADRLTRWLSNHEPQFAKTLTVNAISTAKLSGSHFNLEPLSATEQNLPTKGSSLWEWRITPLMEGDQSLKLHTATTLNVLGIEVLLSPQEATIHILVESYPFEAVKKYFRKYYIGLLVVLGMLIALAIGFGIS